MNFLIIFLLTLSPIVNGLNMFISKFESPPVRFVTDGVLVVGITDGICSIKTKWREASKKAAGMTYSEVVAVDFLREMDNYGFESIDAFSVDDVIKVTLNADFNNCKVVKYNFTDYITDEEYIASNSVLQKVSNNNGFSQITDFVQNTSNEKKKDKLDLMTVTVSVVDIFLFIAFCAVLCCKYCFNEK